MTETAIPANAGKFYNHAAAFQSAVIDRRIAKDVPEPPREDREKAFEAGFDAAGDYYRPILNRLIEVEGDVMGQFREVYDQLRAAQLGPNDGYNIVEVEDAIAKLFDILGLDGAE